MLWQQDAVFDGVAAVLPLDAVQVKLAPPFELEFRMNSCRILMNLKPKAVANIRVNATIAATDLYVVAAGTANTDLDSDDLSVF